jgi:hypothetical protein
MFADLWDGHGMEDLAPYLGTEDPTEDIPSGLKRLLVHESLRGLWLCLDGGESEQETRAALPEWLGIAETATEDEIRGRLIEEAQEAGLTRAEMKSLLRFLGAQTNGA